MTTGDQQVIRDVEIGPPAHGGHCVARVDGRVVFVRHTAPGEVVDIAVTDSGADRRFWRADAVAVHRASPDRVPSRWPEAGPGGVGGGELAHLDLAAQRRWKEDVVADTLRRIGHLQHAVTVHPLGADDARVGLGTRTRVELVLDDHSRPGMFRHRSHEVQALTHLPLAVPAIGELDLFAPGRWDGMAPGTRLEVVAPSNGAPVVLVGGAVVDGPRARAVRERVATRLGELDYRVDASGFWQVHRDAPATLVEAVLAAATPQPGERVVELYSGAGLLTLPLALAVGPTGRVDAVEVDQRAVQNARRNLHAAPQAVLHQAQVRATTVESLAAGADVVVLDPPRSGAGPAVMSALAGLAASRIVYVACDPAALARDLRTAVDLGYRVVELAGYDLFPHTHHIECVALLVPAEAGPR